MNSISKHTFHWLAKWKTRQLADINGGFHEVGFSEVNLGKILEIEAPPGGGITVFAGSHNGAKRAAMFYTFFACCKLSDVNPDKWLTKVLEVISDYPCSKLQELFPSEMEV